MWRNTLRKGEYVAVIGGTDPTSRSVTIHVSTAHWEEMPYVLDVLAYVSRIVGIDAFKLGDQVSTIEIDLFNEEGVARGIANQRQQSSAVAPAQPKQDRRTHPQTLQARVRRR